MSCNYFLDCMSEIKEIIMNLKNVIKVIVLSVIFTTTANAKSHAHPIKNTGIASWYGYTSVKVKNKHGKIVRKRAITANGEIFNPNAMTAAHKTLPFGTKVKVTNLTNKKSVNVVISDRGPFVKGRIIDLSKGAAKVIKMDGTAKVTLHVM